MTRIDSLDWQRGLLAFAIMAYHLTGWELHPLDSSSFLGRLGIYGVSMFFVLSGLSMALVYNRYIQGLGSAVRFFVRRIFRIWPLLWLAVAFATGAAMLAGQKPEWGLIALNLTTVFGFVSPSAYINIGAWSIGNEMVYYALTPLIISAFNRRIWLGNLLTCGAVVVACWFSFGVLNPAGSLAEQWAQYINPFNNLFLYCGGIALYYNVRDVSLRMDWLAALFFAGLAVFLFYPVSGDQINIVTGGARVAFSLASLMLVLAFYKNTVALPNVLAAPLTQLGVVTYGVYLLHPIVYRTIIFGLKKLHMQLPPAAMIGMTVGLTVVAALLSFRLLEDPFVRIGKRLTSQRSGQDDRAAALAATPTPR